MVSSNGMGIGEFVVSRRRVLGAALAAPLLSVAPRGWRAAAAQSPSAVGEPRMLDLAAIPPRGADVPTGFRPNGDSMYERSPFAWLLSSGGTIAAERRYHQGYPSTSSNETAFRGFFLTVTEFETVADAEASFATFEKPEAIVISDPATIALTPMEPLGSSDGAEFLGTRVLDDRANGGWVGQSVVSVFRIDNLVVEISADLFMDPRAEANASPVAAMMATPVVAEASLPEVARRAGDVTADRARAVLAGQPVTAVNPALPAEVLPIQQTWPESNLAFEGYRDAYTTFDGDLDSFTLHLKSGYQHGLTVNSAPNQFDPPYVAVSVTQFDNAESTATFMSALERSIDDLQTPGPTPRGAPRTLTTALEIPGADRVLAYFSRLDPAAADDSAGIVFGMADRFAQIEVQGAGREASLAAATELALAQATCSSGGSCAAPAVPAGLAG